MGDEGRAEGMTDHTWEVIGDTTFSGPTWCQLADVLFCAHCGRYATRTHTYLDVRAADRRAVAQRQTAERERYWELLARHRARRGAEGGPPCPPEHPRPRQTGRREKGEEDR